ncbi:hypothetical protein HKCCE2091_15500 [Rhodobacterales bacterium HKCCE2091]|nr:hypothetical protein [Rhodobacterales bacterium HKCCE2091]
MTVSRIHFTMLPVEDQDRALAFYTGTLGFEVERDEPYSDNRRWIFLRLPGGGTMLQFAAPGDVTVAEGRPALVLVCGDPDAEAARLAAAGVEITAGPGAAPWDPAMRWLMIRDTEGNLVLLQTAPEPGA